MNFHKISISAQDIFVKSVLEIIVTYAIFIGKHAHYTLGIYESWKNIIPLLMGDWQESELSIIFNPMSAEFYCENKDMYVHI